MDITERKITKIAREAQKLVLLTMRKRASAQRRSTSSMRCATIPAVRRPSWPNCCTQTRRLSPGEPKIWKGRVI